MLKKLLLVLLTVSFARADLDSLKTEIANHQDYKDLTDQQWIDKSALRGLTHRSQKDFDWWEGIYPKKIEAIRAQLAGPIVVLVQPGMTKQEYDDQVAEYTAYLEAKEKRLLDKLAAVIEEQLPAYPLSVCPVSGRELGEMGDPYNHVHGTRLVRFCCGGCLDTFNEDPAQCIAQIDAAAAAEATEGG